MEILYAPWRIRYVLGKEKEPGCVFCNAPASQDDEKFLMVHRTEGAFTMLNRFPYTNGHVLICPYRHVSDICDLSAQENSLLIQEVTRAIHVLRSVMKPSGLNVGLNLGVDAGAGIEAHLHYHVVPRWRGDTNMMAATADVRVIPEDLASTRRRLSEEFSRLFPGTPEKVQE